jgi:hypothetical protein
LVADGAFDTIYHEHFSYLTIVALRPLFERHGLTIVDVERLRTHGGSLRVFARHAAVASVHARVAEVVEAELAAKLHDPQTYRDFTTGIEATRHALLAALEQARAQGQRVAAYGAAAKGNTLLNTFGITSRSIPYVVDRNPHKIGRYMPGSHIPIVELDVLIEQKPDWILVLPWNVADEISHCLAFAQAWNAKLYAAIPHFRELPHRPA